MKRTLNLLLIGAVFCTVSTISTVFSQNKWDGIPYNVEGLEPVGPPQKAIDPFGRQHKFIARIGSVKMCPGEVADIPVYIQQYTKTQWYDSKNDTFPFNVTTLAPPTKWSLGKTPLTLIQMAVLFADTSVIEPVPLYPDAFTAGGYTPTLPYVHPFMAKHPPFGSNYIVRPISVSNITFPRVEIMWVYVPPTPNDISPFTPDTNAPIFTIRVKMKKEGNASLYIDSLISFVGGAYNVQFHWTMFNGIIEPNRQYDIPSDIVKADFMRADPPIPNKTYHIGGRVTQAAYPNAYAGADTSVCVSQLVSLNGASGGVGYHWQALDAAMDGIVSSHDVQTPTFSSSTPGTYSYRVKVMDERGCASYDTMQVIVHPNLISTVMTRDSLIDSNAVFPFMAEVTSGHPSPLGMSYSPTDYINGQSVFTTTEDTLKVYGETNPMITPVLFTAASSDLYCVKEEPVLVNIVGSEVRGNISNFPIVRCGDDATEAITTLYLVTIGGSDELEYKWYATNLQIGSPNPEFISGDTVRNPTVRYYGQCAFTVNIYDPYTGKTTIISDTVEKKSPVKVVNDIERMGYGFICHGDEETFLAHVENLGPTPLLRWRINSRVVKESNSLADTVWTTSLSKGDTVSFEVYSSDICALNSPLVSNIIVPEMYYYSSMQSILGFGDGSSGSCDETFVQLSTLLMGMGNSFRLTWERNGEFYKSDMKTSESGEVEQILDNMPRSNYYDLYRSILTEAITVCTYNDTSFSDNVLVGRAAVAPVQAGMPITYDNYATTSCKDTVVTIYANGIENLGQSFLFFWLVKRENTGIIDTIGYYLYRIENLSGSQGGNVTRPEYPSASWQSYMEGERYIPNLGNIYSRVGTDAEGNITSPPLIGETPLNWFQSKFPLRINEAKTNLNSAGKSVIGNGDSVFYRIMTIYHAGGKDCSTSVVSNVESPKKAIIYFEEQEGSVSLSKVKTTDTCENDPVIYVATAMNDGGMARFEWKLNNDSIGKRGYTSERGDTLYLKTGNVNNANISVTATTAFPCASGFPKTTSYTITGLASNGIVEIQGDTMVCEGAAATVKLDGGLDIFVDLATTKGGLNSELNPSVDGPKKLTFYPDIATGGSYVYYRIKNTANTCNRIDSAFVRTLPDKKIDVRLTVDPYGKLSGSSAEVDTLVWCASNEMLNFRFDAYYEDVPEHKSLLNSSQYTFFWELKPSGNPDREWGQTAGTHERNQMRRAEYSDRTIRVSLQNIRGINTCNSGPHYSRQIHFVFLPNPKFHSSVQTNYIFCSNGSEDQKISVTMEDTVRTWYNYLWINSSDGSIVSESNVLDVSNVSEQKPKFELFVQDKDSACPAIWANINVTRAVDFPNSLYTNHSALDMDMIKVSTGEKVTAPVFCPGEDSVLMKLVFHPYLRSHSAGDRYSVIERLAAGTAGQRVLRNVASGDSMMVWFHRNYDRTYIEHRIDTIGCGYPESYTWLEVYDPYNTSASTQIEPHASYIKYHDSLVKDFAVGKDSTICNDNLVPVLLTAAGIEHGSFVWLPAAGLNPGDLSQPNIVVNPTASTTYKGVLHLGDGCRICDSAIIEVFSATSGAHIALSTKDPVSDNNNLTLCDVNSGEFKLFIDVANSSASSTFKRYEWFVNGVKESEVSDTLTITLNDKDSIYVKAFLLDELKTCAPDSIAVSNVYKVKRYAKPTVIAAKDTTICEGESVLLSFGGTGISYILHDSSGGVVGSNSTGIFNVSPSKTTEYEVFALSENTACYSTAKVIVTVNKIVVVPRFSIVASVGFACGNDSLEYSVVSPSNDFHYEWFVNNLASGISGDVFRANVASTDSVQCKSIYIGSACISPEDSVVWSNKIACPRYDIPALKRLLPLAEDTTICQGSSVLLSFDLGGATGNSWTPQVAGSGASVTAAPLENTVYKLSAWFNPSCVAMDSVSIKVESGTLPLPSATISTTSNDQICGDTSVVYTLTSCISCDSAVWYVGSKRYASVAGTGNSIVRIPAVGFDTVSVYAYRANNGACDIAASAQSNLIVINKQLPPTVRIDQRDTTINEGDMITLSATGAANFAWSPAIHFPYEITGSEVIAEPIETAVLRVTGYNYVFCTGTDAITVTVIPIVVESDSNLVYIPTAVVLTSPRTEDHIFTVQGLKVRGADIEIYNHSGAKVFDQDGLSGTTPVIPVWSPQTASAGNYNYRIRVELDGGEVKMFRGWVSVVK
jgi:hypothetical protein